MKAFAVTQHAVDRYLERSQGSKEQRAIAKLFAIADKAIPLGRGQFYADGWIIAVKSGEIRTVFRPRTPAQLAAVHRACAKAREEADKPKTL